MVACLLLLSELNGGCIPRSETECLLILLSNKTRFLSLMYQLFEGLNLPLTFEVFLSPLFVCYIAKNHDIHIKPKSYKLEFLGELIV